MNHEHNSNESGPHLNQTKEHNKSDLSLIESADWIKTIGKTLRSKDGLDMGKIVKDNDGKVDYQTSYSIMIEYGDHERFSIPKHTVYKFDQTNAYASLTENEILAIKDNDPFLSSYRSYVRD
ncbi:hypothetical protein [Nitrososphaera sp. AFS]|uniref:hypothetical protein n=1 Tax=Nitrososphaera sp. AFS TaxID=2301191 RepID=UPI00139232F3|nr:hypothetical protein [Nitrososphaera sp. AFS]NAL78723.1 hypothetical protein [Nitrososphaera sp. AFS]